MIRIHLNCGHGRLIDPTSHEADEILRTQTAACKTCPVQFGEQRYEGITTDADAKYGLPDSLKRLTEARASQPQPRTMKIAVYMSVTVDVDAMVEAYGIDEEAIREDVKLSVLNAFTSGGIYGDERVVVDAHLTN